MLIHTLLAEAWNLQNNKTYYDNEEYLQKYVFIQKTINNKIIFPIENLSLLNYKILNYKIYKNQ